MLDLINILSVCDSLDTSITKITSMIYNLILFGVPIILIIWGSMDMVQAAMAKDEGEIKKAQSLLGKRIVAGVLVFLVLGLVKFIISAVAPNSEELISCIDKLISNSSGNSGQTLAG